MGHNKNERKIWELVEANQFSAQKLRKDASFKKKPALVSFYNQKRKFHTIYVFYKTNKKHKRRKKMSFYKLMLTQWFGDGEKVVIC